MFLEKDDFDCTAQITDKLVTLGLDDALKNDSRKGAELTEKEKLALQMKSDEDIGLELLGVCRRGLFVTSSFLSICVNEIFCLKMNFLVSKAKCIKKR